MDNVKIDLWVETGSLFQIIMYHTHLFTCAQVAGEGLALLATINFVNDISFLLGDFHCACD